MDIVERTAGGTSWDDAPLATLVQHILDQHHAYTRQALVKTRALIDQAHAEEGAARPDVAQLRRLFGALHDDLVPHMRKEEMVLFPFICELVDAEEEGRDAPMPPFGTIRNPVHMMNMEHDAVSDILRELRLATSSYQPPPGASRTIVSLYEALAALDADLVEHIRLETDVLFPRAAEIEARQL